MTINPDLEAATAAWQELMTEASAGVVPERKFTAEQRQEKMRQAFSTVDMERLLGLIDTMSGFVDQVLANTFDPDCTERCTEAELEAYMREQLNADDIKDLIEMRYQMIRARIFAHITAANADEKVPHPDLAPGEVPVPALGYKFVRLGGRQKFTLDFDVLATLLGPERWTRVYVEKTVPAHTERVLDQNALLALVKEDPSVMESVRQAVCPGGTTAQSFHKKPMKG